MIEQERRARRLLVAGPVVAAIGIALTASLPDTLTMIGGATLIAGFLGAVWGTHLFGRLGADHGASHEQRPTAPKQ
ncbi:MAG: hypothetical protein ACHREM_01930 [Polyangiales bacterium]